MSSRMRSSSYLKPPLPKSPIRLRSRQASLSNSSSTTLQTTPGLKKPGRRLSHGDMESKLPIEYSPSFSSEIHALAKTVETEEEDDDLRKRAAASNLEDMAANSAPVFERGRFYHEYSARRNDRLKRKNGGGGGDDDSVVKGTHYILGVEPITTKRRATAKKKTTTTVETTATTPRYSLRSMTKENKKPPLLPMNVSTVTSAKTKSVTTMTSRRI